MIYDQASFSQSNRFVFNGLSYLNSANYKVGDTVPQQLAGTLLGNQFQGALQYSLIQFSNGLDEHEDKDLLY